MNVERRSFSVTTRRDLGSRSGRLITGYAAVFNQNANRGIFQERIAPGTFRRAIAEDDVRCLFNHDSNYVLGRNRAGTLRLTEDRRGLFMEAEPPDVEWARALVAGIERGDITGQSFGFIVTRETWDYDGEMPLRTIEEVQLFDVGPVTFPAYRNTNVSVRAMAQAAAMQEGARLALMKMRLQIAQRA